MRALLAAWCLATCLPLAARGEALPTLLTSGERQVAARAIGDYLTRVTDADGRFVYLYTPATGRVGQEYNLLRHAGTIMALVQLQEATGNENYGAAAARAAAWLRRQIREVEIDGRRFQVLVSTPEFTGKPHEGPVIKTGGCALALIAFSTVDRVAAQPRYRDDCAELARYLVYTQVANGNVRSKYLLNQAEYSLWRSEYYPGEALVALARYHRVAPDPALRQAIARLLIYLAQDWDIRNHQSVGERRGFDHWSLIGMDEAIDQLRDDELAKASPEGDPWTRDAVIAMAVSYVDTELKQQVLDGDERLIGTFTRGIGSTTHVATQLEGMQAVQRTLRRHGRARDDWPARFDLSLRFVLRGQYSAADALPTGQTVDIAGAIRQSVNVDRPADAEIRIDYCQHAISALLDR